MSESFLLDRACSLDKRNKFCSEGISSVLACGLLSIINFYFIIVNLVEQGTKQPLLR